MDELAGISLSVEAFLHDPVEQLASGDPGRGKNHGGQKKVNSSAPLNIFSSFDFVLILYSHQGGYGLVSLFVYLSVKKVPNQFH